MSILDEFPEKDKWIGGVKGEHTVCYIQWLENKIESLNRALTTSRKSLEAIRQREVRRYKHEQDYLPYEERYE